MTSNLFRPLVGLSVVAMLLSACGGDDESTEASTAAPAAKAAGASAASGGASPLLAYVPADTPYFIGNREKMDDKSMDLMWEMAAPALEYAESAVSKAMEDPEAEENPVAKAVMEELAGKMNRDGLVELGLDPAGSLAVYGLGILPVIRAEIADGDKLKETISRIEAKSGQTFTVSEFEGNEFYENGDEKAQAIIAINDDQVVMSIIPTAAREEGLKQLFTDSKPAENITARLDEINSEYELLPIFTIFMDSMALVDAVLTDDSPVASTLFEQGRSQLGPECTAEFKEMAGIAPMVVSGYTQFNDEAVDSIAVIELRDDIATATQQLAAPMGGMGDIDDVLFHMGFAIDVLKAKQFLTDQANAVSSDPYQCNALAELNEGMSQMSAQLAQPLPPMVGNFQGLRFSLKDMDLSTGMPQNLRALVMVGITNPQLVVGMASAMVPQLASLQLPADGTPTPLPDGLIPFPLDTPHLAMTEQGIGMSAGTGEESMLKDYLSAPPASGDLPFMVVGYDEAGLAMYQQQIQEAMAAMAPGEEMPEFPMSDLFSRQTISASFTGRGMEMFSRAYLKQ
ncbi:MAG: hypothetical protein AAF736_09575 [Pseudomonadota bacterium]